MALACVNADQIQEMVRVKYGKVAKNLKKQVEEASDRENSEDANESPDLRSELSHDLTHIKVDTIPGNSDINHFEKFLPNNWLKVYQANQKYLTDLVEEAKNFIQTTKSNLGKKVAVAYSGGKDSLCTLLLTVEALGPNFQIFFADTGLELPEILENTKITAELLGMGDKLLIKSAGNKFWELIDTFGPPSRDYRFCCHTLKAQQIIDIITELSGGERILVFLGQRRYESYTRSEEKRVYVNSFIPMQIAATPIREWNALELWLYTLFYPHFIDGKRIVAPVTHLYFEGFERLGCYLCPAASIHSMKLTSELYPDLVNKWNNWLSQYSEKYGFPKEWLQYGLWRFKNVNLMWKNTLKELGIKYDLKQTDRANPIQVSFTQGFSPCSFGGYSLKGRVNCVIDIDLIRPLLPIIKGESEIHEDMGVISIKHEDYLINLFTDGSFYIRLKEQNYDYDKVVHKLIGLIVKTHQCNGCGVCEKICTKHVIKVVTDDDSGIRRPIIPEELVDKCAQCGFCITHCPLYQKIKDNF
jgi:phosphoadenosine phosphosulfate reductase